LYDIEEKFFDQQMNAFEANLTKNRVQSINSLEYYDGRGSLVSPSHGTLEGQAIDDPKKKEQQLTFRVFKLHKMTQLDVPFEYVE
jgi:hypothetical protein